MLTYLRHFCWLILTTYSEEDLPDKDVFLQRIMALEEENHKLKKENEELHGKGASSCRNPGNLSNKIFFDEFSLFLEQFSTNSSSLLIIGDFNFHIDDPTNTAAKQFHDLLEIFDVKQFVDQPTYQDKHVLDLVIT